VSFWIALGSLITGGGSALDTWASKKGEALVEQKRAEGQARVEAARASGDALRVQAAAQGDAHRISAQGRFETEKAKADVARMQAETAQYEAQKLADAAWQERVSAAAAKLARDEMLDRKEFVQLEADLSTARLRLEQELAEATELREQNRLEFHARLWETEVELKKTTVEWFLRMLSNVSLQHAEATHLLIADIDKLYGSEQSRLIRDHEKRRTRAAQELEEIETKRISDSSKARLADDVFKTLDHSNRQIESVQQRIEIEVPKIREQILRRLDLDVKDVLGSMVVGESGGALIGTNVRPRRLIGGIKEDT